MQIEISGIKIELRKKNIKNLHLVVAPPDGKVRVSAPMHLSDESINMFVRTKLGWIKKQQEKFQHQPRRICFGRNVICLWQTVLFACGAQL